MSDHVVSEGPAPIDKALTRRYVCLAKPSLIHQL
jgi:hypothetical protein